MVSFIIFHQRSVKRFLVRLMIPPKGQMMMVQQLQLDLRRLLFSIRYVIFHQERGLTPSEASRPASETTENNSLAQKVWIKFSPH